MADMKQTEDDLFIELHELQIAHDVLFDEAELRGKIIEAQEAEIKRLREALEKIVQTDRSLASDAEYCNSYHATTCGNIAQAALKGK